VSSSCLLTRRLGANAEPQILLFHLSRDLCPQLARTFGVSQRGHLLALEELRSDPAVDADHWTSEPTTGSRRGQAGEEAEHAVDGRLRRRPGFDVHQA
jgi:hypothetical protein